MKYILIITLLISLKLFSQEINSITIIGNKITKDYIIKREIYQNIPGILDSAILIADKNRLYNLGIFSEVNINVINKSYTIKLVESFHYILYPAIDVDETKPLSRAFSIGIGLINNNFYGLKQDLIVSAIFGTQNYYTLYFHNPWVFGDHISIDASIYKRSTQSSIFLYQLNSSGLYIGSGFHIGKYNKFKFLTGYKYQTMNKIESDEERIIVSNTNDSLYQSYYFYQEYIHDTRDIYIDPTTGHFLKIILQPHIGLNGSKNYYYNSFEFRQYFKLKKLLDPKLFEEPILISRTKYVFQFSKYEKTPLFLYNYLDGENGHVRGYSQTPTNNEKEPEKNYLSSNLLEQLQCDNFLFQSFQFQSTLFERQNIQGIELGMDYVFFTDFGLGTKKNVPFNIQNLLFGFGVGTRIFISGVGVLSIDVGFNKFGAAHIHLSD